THGNVTTGPLSDTTLGVAAGMLRQQQTISGGLMSLAPRTLLVGPTQEGAASKLLTALTPRAQQPLEPVVDAHLGASAAWYLFANPQTRPALVFGHLGENEAPSLLARMGFYSDGMEFRASSDFGCGAVDWRPIVRSTGV